MIEGDELKIAQVFKNLIDNAIKYTDEGGVNVLTNVQDADVLIEINDTGRGMSEDLIKRIFEKYSRGALDKEIVGSGLGLYIAKEIVEAHKGKIWASSEGKDRGSKFFVLLPKRCQT
jgi:signal transduction histidine kinase